MALSTLTPTGEQTDIPDILAIVQIQMPVGYVTNTSQNIAGADVDPDVGIESYG